MPQWIIDNRFYLFLAGAAAAGGLVSFLFACKTGAIRNNKHIRKAMLEVTGGLIVGFFASFMVSEGQIAVAFGGGLAWSAVVNLIRKKVTAIIQATFFSPPTQTRKSADGDEENGELAMPIWLLKTFHFLGLTNLTDEQVEKYVASKKPKIIVSSRPTSVSPPAAKAGRVPKAGGG